VTRRLSSALVVLALTAPGFAEAGARRAAAAAPTFARASVGRQAKAGAAVRVDFRALTDDGHQVTDLKPDEITLKVSGKPRAIQSLSVFHGTASGAATGGSSFPPPYATNAVGREGRVIHLLIDDDSIAPGRETDFREAVRLLAAELAPGDRLGVLTTQAQINLRPIDDIPKIRSVVDGIAGKGTPSETDADAQCRTRRLLAALGSMLRVTGDTPTTIVVFSGGLTPPAQKIIDMTKRAAPTAATAANATNDACPVRPEDFQEIGAVASTAHADLYMFHLTEAMARRSSAQDAGFESLAGVTGAEFARISAGPQAAIARMLRETQAYYVATFEPEPSERTGQAYRLEVRTTRDKVKLRARPAVAIARGEVVKAAPSPKDMLRVAAEYHDLPLRAAAYTSRTAGSDDVTIVALFEGLDTNTAIAAASIGLFDEKNTLKKQWTAQAGDLSKRPVIAALAAPPGTYRMRVAATDATGRAGTTDYELKAEVPRADPLKLSALVLGAQQQGGGFTPRLQFSTEPVAIGLLEIYGVPRGSTVTVDLDVVSSPDGSPIATAPTTVSPGKIDDMRVAFGGFSIASLEPGDYLIRAVVSLDGKPVGRVVRTLRKAP
jgi:hypothetical protein